MDKTLIESFSHLINSWTPSLLGLFSQTVSLLLHPCVNYVLDFKYLIRNWFIHIYIWPKRWYLCHICLLCKLGLKFLYRVTWPNLTCPKWCPSSKYRRVNSTIVFYIVLYVRISYMFKAIKCFIQSCWFLYRCKYVGVTCMFLYLKAPWLRFKCWVQNRNEVFLFMFVFFLLFFECLKWKFPIHTLKFGRLA